MVMKRKLFTICSFLLGMMAIVSCDGNDGETTEFVYGKFLCIWYL